MEEFQQHFTFVSIVSLTVCVRVCAEFTQLSDMLLSFLVVSPAALVYKNLRQNILVKAARKTGSQTRQTIRLAREPIDTHTHQSTHEERLWGDAHTHTPRERLLTAKLRRNINKTVLPSLNLHINIRPTLEIYIQTHACVCAIVLKVKLRNHPQSTRRSIIYVAVCMQCVY